jgi:predicted amidophosphoribosyltransferase
MNFNGKKISEVIKETLWPTRCAICDLPGEVLCESCKKSLPYINLCSACPKCGAPNGKDFCTECNDVSLLSLDLEKYPLDALRSAVVLDDKSRKLITTYKDNFEIRLAKEVSRIMVEYLNFEWLENKTLITYIPSSETSKKNRGFSHMEIIANEIGKKVDVATLNLFLQPKTVDQRKLTRKERVENMKSALQIDKAKVNLIEKKGYVPSNTNVIIADDVCTTGSTLFAASNALREVGFNKIFGLTFARAQN